MVTMTLNDISRERIASIREELVKFSNLNKKRVKGIGSQYSGLPVYATWFGSGRMPIEVDICVLCNILCFTFINKLELNVQDQASIEFVRIAIGNGDIINNSFHISGLYPRPSVILYHITRLCSAMNEPWKYLDIEKLVEMIRHELSKCESPLDRIILSTSLMKLGQAAEPVALELDSEVLKNDFETFPFFIAPMLSGSSMKF